MGIWENAKYQDISHIKLSDRQKLQMKIFDILGPSIDPHVLIKKQLKELYHLSNLCAIKNIKLHLFLMLDAYPYEISEHQLNLFSFDILKKIFNE